MSDPEKSFQCADCLLLGELQQALSDVYRLAQLVEMAMTDTTVKGETTQVERTTLTLARKILAKAARPYQPAGEYYTPEAVRKIADIAKLADGGPLKGNELNSEME